MAENTLTGTIVDYDLGGNGSHGVAALSVAGSRCIDTRLSTLDTVEAILDWIDGIDDLIGVGVNTLSC